MQRSRGLFFDSFKAARGELEPLFSAAHKSNEHLLKEVRQYIIPGLSHRRHRYLNERLSRAQQRSLFRTNVSLVLQEARRRGHARVAAAALDVALTEARPAHLAQEIEPAWVKDAVASCQSVEELRVMEGVLRRHEQQLLRGGTAAGTEGFLLTAAFGRSAAAAATERGRRLGDEDADLNEEHVADSGSALQGSSSGAPNSLVGLTSRDVATQRSNEHQPLVPQEEDERRVTAALTQLTSSADLAVHGSSGGDAASRWASPEARTAAALRRLQRQHTDLTAGPNVSFTRYFLHQGLVRSEGELMALYQAMRSRPDDVAFRVVGGGGEGASSTALPSPTTSSVYSAAVHAMLQRRRGLHRVPWLPASMGAYTLDTRPSVPHDTVLSNRQLLRSLARERLVVYQSLSSMLPVLFLNPQPGEAVLDLCASPGNKTGLILDVMHGGSSAAHEASAAGSVRGGGCVVANEAQSSRVRDLQERLRDVSPDVAVTRGHGQTFGASAAASQVGNTSQRSHHKSSLQGTHDSLFAGWTGEGADDFALLSEEGFYDGVLVDAPCSGEGRMGRDALSWRLWHPGRGLEFFPLQCRLLHRAVQLCKTGGRVVYATCTLNPMENEAVVAAVLRACSGAVELVPPPPLPYTQGTASLSSSASNRDATSLYKEGWSGADEGTAVPPLRLTPGLRTWDVPSSAGGFLHTPAEAYAQGENRNRLLPEMFAVDEARRGGEGSEEEDERIGAALHRCCRRIMPHLNGNTDGFFVAVFRKKSSVQRSLAAATFASSAHRPDSATGGLTGASRAAASTLVASLSGGSNLLMDRGLVRLQASNHIVQKYLGGFFAPPPPASLYGDAALAQTKTPVQQQQSTQQGCPSVQSFLDRHGWTALWCEGEGLRLASDCAVQLLHRHSTTARHTLRNEAVKDETSAAAAAAGGAMSTALAMSGGGGVAANSNTALLDVGVMVVDANGALTERGAVLLRSGATSRVLTLPLPYAQLLLANRTLDIGGSMGLLPAFMQEAEVALRPHQGFLRSSSSNINAGSVESSDTPLSAPAWCLEALQALRHAAAGNAIVCIDVSASTTTSSSPVGKNSEVDGAGSSRPPQSGSLPSARQTDKVWARLLSQWSWPVRVEVLRPWSSVKDLRQGLVRLHLTLSPPSRHRTLALIGRLQGHAHRFGESAEQQQRAQLQASEGYAPSTMMGSRDLHGASTQPAQQHRQLFHKEGRSAAQDALERETAATVTSATTSSNVFEL